MKVNLISHNKKDFLDLLLLADEQENMIDTYLERGQLFALYDNDDLKSICVVTKEDETVCELKNLATYEKDWRHGYGQYLVSYICDYYKDTYNTMIVGTGDSPITVPFYLRCGFTITHRLENYLLEHYDNPIIENGIQLFDVVYLSKSLK